MTRPLKIFFTLSVALNVILLGAGAGFAFKKWHEAPWQDVRDNLSPQGRAMFDASLGKMQADLQPLWDEIKKSREDLKGVMREDSFNSEKFDAIAAHMKDVRRKMGDKFTDSAKEMAAALPVEERRKMADALLGGFDKHGRHGPWSCKDQSAAGKQANAKTEKSSEEKSSQDQQPAGND